MIDPSFIESICFKNGKYQLLELHQERIFSTFSHFFDIKNAFLLQEILPSIQESGKFKVRVVYSKENFEVEIVPYQPKTIHFLSLVQANDFDYAFKYEDRTYFQQLKKQSKADEIIISKNGLVTDGSYANLVFWDGKNWITPNTPLLNGVKRQYLLATGAIQSKTIMVEDISKFEKIGLINSMLDLGEVEISKTHLHN